VFINQEREKKGWKPLAVVTIPLISNHSSLATDVKLSSTSLRQQEYESLKAQGKL
jgi:phosphopantetheine adenylyltransferase